MRPWVKPTSPGLSILSNAAPIGRGETIRRDADYGADRYGFIPDIDAVAR
jgi:hypothetical protein